jgi:hypothetical protein
MSRRPAADLLHTGSLVVFACLLVAGARAEAQQPDTPLGRRLLAVRAMVSAQPSGLWSRA